MGEQRPFYEEDNWVKISLAIPFKYNPGTHFVYNNVGPYLAGILVQRRPGCDLVSYLTPRLFSKLGIKRPTLETDPLGNSFGAGGLFLTLMTESGRILVLNCTENEQTAGSSKESDTKLPVFPEKEERTGSWYFTERM